MLSTFMFSSLFSFLFQIAGGTISQGQFMTVLIYFCFYCARPCSLDIRYFKKKILPVLFNDILTPIIDAPPLQNDYFKETVFLQAFADQMVDFTQTTKVVLIFIKNYTICAFQNKRFFGFSVSGILRDQPFKIQASFESKYFLNRTVNHTDRHG